MKKTAIVIVNLLLQYTGMLHNYSIKPEEQTNLDYNIITRHINHAFMHITLSFSNYMVAMP